VSDNVEMPDPHELVPSGATLDRWEGGRDDALVREFLAGRKATTLRTYQSALQDFAAWLGTVDVGAAARRLLESQHGEANRVAHAYRAHLLERRLSPATVNLRLSALRALVTLARVQGLVQWVLEVAGVKAEPLRDTRGPGRKGVRAVHDELAATDSPKQRRDRAMVRLLTDLALRRGEVVALDLEDLDLDAGTIAVVGKGHTSKAKLTLPEPTKTALAAWVAARGADAGPLFVNFDRRGTRSSRALQRLTGTSVHRIVADLGLRARLTAPLRPHGLRHAAITEALEISRGNVRAAQKFSRHADPRTLLVYDDAREDVAGEVARQVAAWR
jgi:integrase/recombinase XerC